MPKKKATKADTTIQVDAPISESQGVVQIDAEKVVLKPEPTDLEKIEAEMHEISPTLADLKKNDRAKYIVAYRRYMWLIGERDRIKAEQS